MIQEVNEVIKRSPLSSASFGQGMKEALENWRSLAKPIERITDLQGLPSPDDELEVEHFLEEKCGFGCLESALRKEAIEKFPKLVVEPVAGSRGIGLDLLVVWLWMVARVAPLMEKVRENRRLLEMVRAELPPAKSILEDRGKPLPPAALVWLMAKTWVGNEGDQSWHQEWPGVDELPDEPRECREPTGSTTPRGRFRSYMFSRWLALGTVPSKLDRNVVDALKWLADKGKPKKSPKAGGDKPDRQVKVPQEVWACAEDLSAEVLADRPSAKAGQPEEACHMSGGASEGKTLHPVKRLANAVFCVCVAARAWRDSATELRRSIDLHSDVGREKDCDRYDKARDALRQAVKAALVAVSPVVQYARRNADECSLRHVDGLRTLLRRFIGEVNGQGESFAQTPEFDLMCQAIFERQFALRDVLDEESGDGGTETAATDREPVAAPGSDVERLRKIVDAIREYHSLCRQSNIASAKDDKGALAGSRSKLDTAKLVVLDLAASDLKLLGWCADEYGCYQDTRKCLEEFGEWRGLSSQEKVERRNCIGVTFWDMCRLNIDLDKDTHPLLANLEKWCASLARDASDKSREFDRAAEAQGRRAEAKAQNDDTGKGEQEKKLAPSRLKAQALYEYAMGNIEGADKMTVAELFEAIKERLNVLIGTSSGPEAEKLQELQASMPPTAEAFGKYLRDAGIKRYNTRGDRVPGRSIRRQSEI